METKLGIEKSSNKPNRTKTKIFISRERNKTTSTIKEMTAFDMQKQIRQEFYTMYCVWTQDIVGS